MSGRCPRTRYSLPLIQYSQHLYELRISSLAMLPPGDRLRVGIPLQRESACPSILFSPRRTCPIIIPPGKVFSIMVMSDGIPCDDGWVRSGAGYLETSHARVWVCVPWSVICNESSEAGVWCCVSASVISGDFRRAWNVVQDSSDREFGFIPLRMVSQSWVFSLVKVRIIRKGSK